MFYFELENNFCHQNTLGRGNGRRNATRLSTGYRRHTSKGARLEIEARSRTWKENETKVAISALERKLKSY